MTDVVPKQPWERITGETEAQHAWFKRFVEVGEGRTVDRAAKACGVPVGPVRRAAELNDWAARAKAYDAAVIELRDVLELDETEALHAQYAAGRIMAQLGLTALQYKNPALVPIAQIKDLILNGAEMMRRGAGIADLKVDHSTTHRVESILDDLLGGGE